MTDLSDDEIMQIADKYGAHHLFQGIQTKRTVELLAYTRAILAARPSQTKVDGDLARELIVREVLNEAGVIDSHKNGEWLSASIIKALTTAPDRPDGYTLPDFLELAKTEQKKSDDAEDITIAIYHRYEANKFKAIAALVGTLRYIAVQAKAAHPGALKVIQMNAEAAIAKITADGDGV